jgi:hypothetical protein
MPALEGLLNGKVGLVVGIANEHSIAASCAQLIDGLTRLFCEFKFDRTTGLTLPDEGAVDHVTPRCEVFDMQGDNSRVAWCRWPN